LGKLADPAIIIPIMSPNNPRALPKISITNILMKVDGSWASANAAPLPVTPTHILLGLLFEREMEIPADKV
jgi:hypothetical protein